MFIDQFEELFTLTSPAHQARFIAMLGRAAQSPRLRMVLTVRADFYHHCVAAAPLAKLLRTGSFPLAAPDMPALLDMITGPAAVVRVTFVEGLPGRLPPLARRLVEHVAATLPTCAIRVATDGGYTTQAF